MSRTPHFRNEKWIGYCFFLLLLLCSVVFVFFLFQLSLSHCVERKKGAVCSLNIFTYSFNAIAFVSHNAAHIDTISLLVVFCSFFCLCFCFVFWVDFGAVRWNYKVPSEKTLFIFILNILLKQAIVCICGHCCSITNKIINLKVDQTMLCFAARDSFYLNFILTPL